MALLIDETELMRNFDEDMAFKLLSELYVTADNKPLDRSEFTLDDKYIDYDGDLYISPTIKNKVTTLEIPGFVLREVRGSFNCRLAVNLKNLKGAPERVTRLFDCTLCSSLTTLEGAPEDVGGNFVCGLCDSLKSLKGAPKKIGRNFECTLCGNLESLEGAPEEIGSNFVCYGCDNLNFTKNSLKNKR